MFSSLFRSDSQPAVSHSHPFLAANQADNQLVAERRFQWRLDDGILVISLTPHRLVDDEVVNCVFNQLAGLLQETGRSLILLDFSRVRLFSTATLGRLVTLEKRLKSMCGQLQLCAIGPEICQIFQSTRLDQYFRIHQTVEEGVRDF